MSHGSVLRLALSTSMVMMALVLPSGAQTPDNRLLLADAEKLIAAAVDAATKMNVRVSVAVVDSRGDLIAVARMPGTIPDTAIGKAMTAAIFREPSSESAARATSPIGQSLNEASGGRLRFFRGGLPIVRNGIMIGAAGASGATAQQDEDAVRAGLKALGL